MKIIHLSAPDFRTSTWSGGTTTELFLYPADGSYAQRNFQLRISSATVDLEESDFTPLPGVMRYITPLQGSFTLTHPGSVPVVMDALAAPYRFSGETPTHCVGKATDFNLMLKNCDGRMQLHRGSAPIAAGFNAFYPTADTRFTLDGVAYEMKAGDLLVIFSETSSTLSLGAAPALTCWANI
ncbi:MAG: HutD family protein [Oscillospiraceae bacterium]|nr:HutD family protein [Oscillospiraceae bacterium]